MGWIDGAFVKFQWNESHYERIDISKGPLFNGTQSLFESEKGDIWFGGGAGGLIRYAGENKSVIDRSQKRAATSFEDAGGGDVWVGYDTGEILKTSGDQLLSVYGLNRFTTQSISTIHSAEDQSLWIGTFGDGLFHWENDGLTQFGVSHGLPSNEIGGFIVTHDAFWIATKKGVARVFKSQLELVEAREAETVQCLVFSVEDGLPNLECSSNCFPSAVQSGDGTLWFATVEGVASIHPNDVPKSDTASEIFIEEIIVDGKSISLESDLVSIPPGPLRLSFRYSSITLSNPRQAKFQYRLEGHDEDWVEAWNQREAHYTKPDPGLYQFKVRASNHQGGWGKGSVSRVIRIEPFPWQRRSFQITVGLITSFLVALVAWLSMREVYRNRIQSLIRAQALEKERARIAEDLHDHLGAQSTQMIFQSKALAEHVSSKDRPELHSLTDQIQRIARDMALGLDEIVWTTDPSKDNVESSMAFFLAYAEVYFKDTPIRLRIDIPLGLESRGLSTELRHQVFLAVREALTNVLKHSKASEIWLRIHFKNHHLVLAVEDNGIGIPSIKKQMSRNGLVNIRRRIESIGGVVNFKPGKGGGFSVQISAPLR